MIKQVESINQLATVNQELEEFLLQLAIAVPVWMSFSLAWAHYLIFQHHWTVLKVVEVAESDGVISTQAYSPLAYFETAFSYYGLLLCWQLAKHYFDLLPH